MNLEFMHGGITILFILAGLFFFRFWRDTLDRLFLLFALSFWLQALTRMGLEIVGGQEERAYLYLLRLLAFLLIVAAIAMKNVPQNGTSNKVVED
ncbi:MAG TPA: DUF5985 family protein [Burkholderiales bacterium]|jgi:hypothetical protein